MDKKIYFLILYLIIDLIYVNISRDVYDNTTVNIQGSPMKVRPYSVLFAYLSMLLGWYYFVTPKIKSKDYYNAITTGIIYGLSVYGTFNFTCNAMFNNWNTGILIRDLTWGISCSIFITLLYSYYI